MSEWRTNRRTGTKFPKPPTKTPAPPLSLAFPYGRCQRCRRDAFIFISKDEEWQHDVPPEWVDKVLCIDCYNEFRRAMGKPDYTYEESKALRDEFARHLAVWHEFYDSHPELNYAEKQKLWRELKLVPEDSPYYGESLESELAAAGAKWSDKSILQEHLENRMEIQNILDASGLRGKKRKMLADEMLRHLKKHEEFDARDKYVE